LKNVLKLFSKVVSTMTKKTEASLALELKLPEPPADERIGPAKAKN
jgi:hypothetical protein